MIKTKILYIVAVLSWVFFMLYSCLSLNYYFSHIYSSVSHLDKFQFFKKPTIDSFLFVGDIMFDRGIATHIDKFGQDSLFRNIQSIMNEPDVVVGNLEGTITDHASISQKNNKILRFTFKPDTVNILKKSKINIVTLANNHSQDFGYEGYNQTINNLNQSGIKYFGSAHNDVNLSLKVFLHGMNYCFVGYHDLFDRNYEPASKEIKVVRNQCDKVIVFAHWGDEYNTSITERQKKIAHDFIDSGADIIIGSHPHVVEPIEIYKNRVIFYSLGNFIFDQNLSFATEHGLMVGIDFSKNRTSFRLIPTSIINREVYVATSTDASIILNTLSSDDSIPGDVRESISNFGQF